LTRSFKVQTGAKTSVTNITDLVRQNLQGVREALVQVSIPHTTAAVFLAEDDAELREDYVRIATETFAAFRPFKHIRKNNPNTEAHVFSSLFGAALTITVREGAPLLGTYQNILLLEMDGPKERTVHVSVFHHSDRSGQLP
jgi:secondary thiamine-phosphate synthase enzyme